LKLCPIVELLNNLLFQILLVRKQLLSPLLIKMAQLVEMMPALTRKMGRMIMTRTHLQHML